jgi:hypothetical protein
MLCPVTQLYCFLLHGPSHVSAFSAGHFQVIPLQRRNLKSIKPERSYLQFHIYCKEVRVLFILRTSVLW